MNMINEIEAYLKEIEKEVIKLVENREIALTQKNMEMKPLVDQKRILESALAALKEIENTDYQGLCSGLA